MGGFIYNCYWDFYFPYVDFRKCFYICHGLIHLYFCHCLTTVFPFITVLIYKMLYIQHIHACTNTHSLTFLLSIRRRCVCSPVESHCWAFLFLILTRFTLPILPHWTNWSTFQSILWSPKIKGRIKILFGWICVPWNKLKAYRVFFSFLFFL